MKKSIFILWTAALCAVAFSCDCKRESDAEIVPLPVSVSGNCTDVKLPAALNIFAADEQLRETASVWIETFRPLCSASIVENRKDADIVLLSDGSLAEEEYVLKTSSKNRIAIKGGSAAGVWWGLQTLSQILLQSRTDDGFAVSGITVSDKPRFAYRGGMFDCCRHFFTVDEVKKFIDILALHKLNTFHWHLTEDQGWRIEIEKYPLLTEVGSVRKETIVGHMKDKDRKFDGTPYGGYFTKEQVRDVVAYAAARHITVIPEIEMPGHAVAALTAYPYLGCRGEGYEVWTVWGISKDVFCIGKESTFEFLEDVLDEVCELFPGEYIHIGGDEAPHVRWETCPHCQARMKAEGLSEARQLQGYMLKRIEAYLAGKGKKIIGWDEVLEAGVTPTATVMSWRGPKGGIKAAQQGNDVVMAPNSYFYLDYYQTEDPAENGEPLAIGGFVSLEKCYSFDPFDQLDEETSKHIKGVQANLWTEYIADFGHAQTMLLPRYSALSEVDWSEEKTSYEEFRTRVEDVMLPMYDLLGYKYARYAFEK